MEKRVLSALMLSFLSGCTGQTPDTQFNAKQSWQELTRVLHTEYAYLDKAPDALALLPRYETLALTAKSDAEFRDIAQAAVRSFSDPHLNLGPYDNQDFSVYPTGSDIYARFEQGTAVVRDVKANSDAFHQGVRPDMSIQDIDGKSPEAAVEHALAMAFEDLSVRQRNYALNVALGGKRFQPRTLILKATEGTQTLSLGATYDDINKYTQGPAVSVQRFDDIGYLRFNNGLGNSQTVEAFRHGLAQLQDTRALILDLRNTPSGGNTSVAEPILGHFVQRETSYQLYRTQQADVPYTQAELTQAKVSPQLPYVDKPFVVLAGHWTGSMGEGMTIGLNALGAKAVIGSGLADLLGGIKRVELARSGAWLEIAFERLYQTNGDYREDFMPGVYMHTADTDATGQDPALETALSLFNAKES